MSGSGEGGSGTSFRAAMSRARSRPAAATAAPLASAARSTRLAVSRTPASSSSRPAACANGTGGGGEVVHRGQARRHDAPGDAELGVPGGEAVPALRAVIPGPRHGDQAEHGVEGLVPVGDEYGLVALPARRRAAPGGRGRRPAARPAWPRRAAAARPGSPAPPPPCRRRRSPWPWPPRRRAGLARRPSPARARPGAPLFPSRPGRGIIAGVARHGRAGRADRLVHLRDLPGQVPEPLVLRDLPPGLLQLRPRSAGEPSASARPPSASGSTAARDRDAPARRTRSSACRTSCGPRSATPGGSPRPAPAPRKAQHAGAPVPPAHQARQARHPQSESINTLRLSRSQPQSRTPTNVSHTPRPGRKSQKETSAWPRGRARGRSRNAP